MSVTKSLSPDAEHLLLACISSFSTQISQSLLFLLFLVNKFASAMILLRSGKDSQRRAAEGRTLLCLEWTAAISRR